MFTHSAQCRPQLVPAGNIPHGTSLISEIKAGRSGVVRLPCKASNHFHVSAFSISTLAAYAVPYVPDSGRSVRDAALFSALLAYHICAVLSTLFFQFSVLHKHQQGSLCIVLFFVAVFLLHALSSAHAAAQPGAERRKPETESEAKTQAKRKPSEGQALKTC